MRTFFASSVFFLCCLSAFAQVGGNSVYGQAGANARAEQNERIRRTLSREEFPPSNSVFLEASVLMNVKADEYVAVFGIMQEGTTIAECSSKMDAVVAEFAGALKALGVGPQDYDVDFIAQNKIYNYEVTGEVAKQKLTGFELKKNIAIHYKAKDLLDKLVVAASRSQIYDLIKVDYIVRDTSAVQDRLLEEAGRIVKAKAARYSRLLGTKIQLPAQVYAERPAIYYPTEFYDSYAAFESEDVSAGWYRQKYIIQDARKSRTFFFNPLNAKNFDRVINSVITEPVVQFTMYLKVRYSLAQGKGEGQSPSKSPKPAAGVKQRSAGAGKPTGILR